MLSNHNIYIDDVFGSKFYTSDVIGIALYFCDVCGLPKQMSEICEAIIVSDVNKAALSVIIICRRPFAQPRGSTTRKEHAAFR